MPHIHELIDFTVEVFIVYKNKVLLRKHDKYKNWMSVGGHIEPNEDPNEAALREVKEEVGLTIHLVDDVKPRLKEAKGNRELIPPKFLNRHRINDTHEHVTFVYFATTLNDTVTADGDDRSDDWKWFTKEELEKNEYGILDNILFYANRALEELKT